MRVIITETGKCKELICMNKYGNGDVDNLAEEIVRSNAQVSRGDAADQRPFIEIENDEWEESFFMVDEKTFLLWEKYFELNTNEKRIKYLKENGIPT